MITESLRRMIKELLSSIAYDKIILFGSQARGGSTNQSDFDLLVILKDTTPVGKKIRLSSAIRKSFASKMVDADVLVKDRKDVDYLKDKPGSVIRQAMQEGIVL